MARRVLLVDGDLLSAARLEGAAQAAGARVETCPSAGLRDMLERERFDVVVLDLDGGGTGALDAIAALRGTTAEPARVLAFVSHVDQELRRAASDAGVEAVPRGRFWGSVGQMLSEA